MGGQNIEKNENIEIEIGCEHIEICQWFAEGEKIHCIKWQWIMTITWKCGHKSGNPYESLESLEGHRYLLIGAGKYSCREGDLVTK